jgi:hypothetical protein
VLSAVFRGHPYELVATIVLSLLAAAGAFAHSRSKGRRPWPYAAFSASITAALCLTLWRSGSTTPSQCTVNRDLLEPFLTEQGLLNAALFVPIGVFGVLATRHPLAVALAAPLLSATIEVVQTTSSFVARGCDSSDLEMNTFGAVTGVLATCLALVLIEVPVHQVKYRARVIWRSAGSVAAINALVLVFFVHLVFTDSTSLEFATPDKSSAAKSAVRTAFGNHYRISAVQYRKGYGGTPGTLFITLDKGSAELSWPDKQEFTASLAPDGTSGASYFPVTGITGRPRNAADAEAIATAYAAHRYPWGLTQSQPHSEPVGDNAELGWMISWRRTHGAILMPMRLDIQIDRSGRVSQLLTRHVDDPRHLSPATVTRQQAITAALASADTGRTRGHATGTQLLAVKNHHTWHTYWLIGVHTSIGHDTQLYIDASTGKSIPLNPLPSTDGSVSATANN